MPRALRIEYLGTIYFVTYTYNRLGRRKTVTQNSITTTLTYNDVNGSVPQNL